MANPEDIVIDEIDNIMNDFADRIFELSQDNLTKRHSKKFKSGNSKTVITTDVGTLLKTGNINVNEKLEKTIVYPVPYASDVEFGNNGKEVDIKNLGKWVKRKLLKNKEKSPLKILRVTKNIAKTLRSRGQSPDPFLKPAITQALNEFNLEKR